MAVAEQIKLVMVAPAAAVAAVAMAVADEGVLAVAERQQQLRVEALNAAASFFELATVEAGAESWERLRRTVNFWQCRRWRKVC